MVEQLDLLIFPLALSILVVCAYEAYLRTRNVKCPCCSATLKKVRISNSITHVYTCPSDHYSVAPYLDSGACVYASFVKALYLPLQVINYAKFQLRLRRNSRSVIPFANMGKVRAGLPLVGIIIAVLLGYNLAQGFKLAHSLTAGFIPLLGFSPIALVKGKKPVCSRCGTLVSSASETGHRYLDKVFCSEECLVIYKQNNICSQCGVILDPGVSKNALANKGSFIYFCSTKCQSEFSSKTKVPNEMQVVEKRRSFLKKTVIAGLVGLGLFAAGDFSGFKIAQASVRPPGSNQPTSVDSGYGMTQAYEAIVFQDTNGAYYVKDGNTGELLVLTNSTTQAYANGVQNGVAGTTTTTAGIQEAVSYSLGYDVARSTSVPSGYPKVGGTIFIKSGQYVCTQRIAVPYPLRITGEGTIGTEVNSYEMPTCGTSIFGAIDLYAQSEVDHLFLGGGGLPSVSAAGPGSFPGASDMYALPDGTVPQIFLSVQIGVPNTDGGSFGILLGPYIHDVWMNSAGGIFVNDYSGNSSGNDNLWYLHLQRIRIQGTPIGIAMAAPGKYALGLVNCTFEEIDLEGVVGPAIGTGGGGAGVGGGGNKLINILAEGCLTGAPSKGTVVVGLPGVFNYIYNLGFGDHSFGSSPPWSSGQYGTDFYGGGQGVIIEKCVFNMAVINPGSILRGCTFNGVQSGYGNPAPATSLLCSGYPGSTIYQPTPDTNFVKPSVPQSGYATAHVRYVLASPNDYPTPTMLANPPALSTDYQNLNFFDIDVCVPVTFGTGSSVHVEIAPPIGGNPDTPGTYVAQPTESYPSGTVANLRFAVPEGYFFKIVQSAGTVTLGISVATPHYT